LLDPADLAAASRLAAEVWAVPAAQSPLPPDILRALAVTGNHVAGAWLDGVLVGLAAGFWGRHHGVTVLHSHVACVQPGLEGRGIGRRLKLQQREFVLAHGVEQITWTFDPLVRRNAYFNLTVLGAVATEYHESFYGVMHDGLNDGDESDRCMVVWDLTAAQSSAGRRDHAGARAGGDAMRVQVPDDIVAMRQHDPAAARRWRHDLRSVLQPAFADGYRAVAMSRDGWYTLTRARP
jgi:predicted GNAT superfamily acetyltransferase